MSNTDEFSRKVMEVRHATCQTSRVIVRYNPDTGEYRCRLYLPSGRYEPADYFTDDRADAIGTAKAMISRV